MRIGAKKRPFYRVVVVEERSKRTGGYVELLGTYNPLTEPKEIKLKQDRIDYWTKMGAQPSVGYLRIIGKAPQKAPRKPKKEKKEEPPKQEQEIKATEVKSDADSQLSEEGEGEQSAQALTSTTSPEPVSPKAESELENQVQTNEGASEDQK